LIICIVLSIVLYCIVLYCIVLYCIVLYCIVLYCIVLYCIVYVSCYEHCNNVLCNKSWELVGIGYLSIIKPLKVEALRQYSLQWKIAALVLLKLFISGNERWHTTDAYKFCIFMWMTLSPTWFYTGTLHIKYNNMKLTFI